MTGSLGALDLAVVGVYLAATLVLGVRSSRRARADDEDFLLAGRALTLPAFVVTLVATWYGGVLGVGEYSYAHGLSNWLVLGVPYYVGTFLFAVLFAEKSRERPNATLPDILYDTYGRAAGILGAVTVLALSLPAPYLLMLGVLLRRATGMPQSAAVVLCTGFCLLYIGARGFRSVVQTKGLQFAFMFGGFLLLLPIAVSHVGGSSALRAALPETMFTPLGGQRPGYVFAWYVIALQTLVEPTFFQRCFAAKTPRVARRGLFVSILFFALFDGLTTFTGMYAHALLPRLKTGVDAYPALAELLLPAGLLGVFYAGMIATVMSTVDAFLFNAGITLSRDLIARVGSAAAWTIRGERWGRKRNRRGGRAHVHVGREPLVRIRERGHRGVAGAAFGRVLPGAAPGSPLCGGGHGGIRGGRVGMGLRRTGGRHPLAFDRAGLSGARRGGPVRRGRDRGASFRISPRGVRRVILGAPWKTETKARRWRPGS